MGLYEQYVHQLCKKYIHKDDKVFDCGCGGGEHTAIIKTYAVNVIGGDLENRLKEKYAIKFRKININQYGEENEFDVVTSWDVIEHVKDDFGFLRELTRITKPEGTLIIGTPNKNRLSNKIISFFKGKIKYPYHLGNLHEMGGDIIHLREYTKKYLIDLVEKLDNLEVIDFKESFLGIYTPWGPVGFMGIDQKRFAGLAQHLYIVLRKTYA